jgi:integrase
MASIGYRRGGWELRYRDEQYHQHVERFPAPPTRRPPEQVLDRKAEVERQLRRGSYISRAERDVTFGVYYAKWLATRQVSSARAYTDASRATNHVLPHWRERPLSSIRPSDVDDWIALLATKMGPHAVRHCYTLFRGPIRRAVKDGLMTDPCIDVPLPKKPALRKSFDDVLTAAQVDALVAAIVDPDPGYAALKTNGRYQAMVFAGAWLGPRWNEMLGLRRRDLNPLRHELTLGRVVVNQNGSHVYEERHSKTEDHRTIPVPEEVMTVLVQHLDAYCAGSGPDDFLFLTTHGTHPQRGSFRRDVLTAASHRAQLDVKVSWLTLRHTGASLMFDAGLSLFEVQQRLGHKSPTMTAEVYTHLMRERFDEGRSRLEAYMRDQRRRHGDPSPDHEAERGP